VCERERLCVCVCVRESVCPMSYIAQQNTMLHGDGRNRSILLLMCVCVFVWVGEKFLGFFCVFVLGVCVCLCVCVRESVWSQLILLGSFVFLLHFLCVYVRTSNRKRGGGGGRGMKSLCVLESGGGRHARIDVQVKISILF